MPDYTWLGDRAIRFARPPQTSPRALVRAIRSWPGVRDVVVAREDVAAYFGGVIDPAPLGDQIRALASAADDPEPVRDVVLRAIYDGPDLAAIATASGLTIAEVCELHAAATYSVELVGFAPGFAYLAGLDPRLALARRATPRPRVPAGSLAIAGAHTAVYPFDSPGGWHLVGRVVGALLFGPAGPLLRLGDRVRFEVMTPP